jgi:hypothetical protein
MMPFLKITVDSARRMRSRILSEQIARVGQMRSYQCRRAGRKLRIFSSSFMATVEQVIKP